MERGVGRRGARRVGGGARRVRRRERRTRTRRGSGSGENKGSPESGEEDKSLLGRLIPIEFGPLYANY